MARYVVLVLAFSVSSVAAALDCEQSKNDLDAYAQIKNLDCQLRSIADKINQGNDVVPKYIYHFGKKEYMDENVKNRNVPQKAWDQFIMGGKTRYALAENRRGLYGTGGIDTNGFGDATYNWLIQIQIKDECRRPENVVTYLNLDKSERFNKWYSSLHPGERQFGSTEEFGAICRTMAGDISYTGKFDDSRCEQVFDRYFKDTKVKIVQDHAIHKSFYIRDRNCIETIKGTPEELIEIAAKNDLLWLEPCQNRYGNAFESVLMKALAAYQKEVPPNIVDRLIKNSNLRKPQGTNEPKLGLEAYQRCQQKNNLQDFRNKVANDGSNFFSYVNICN